MDNRKDDNGNPTDIMLLDLQVCTQLSVAKDLNHFLFSSLDGKITKLHMKTFLTEYYTSFSEVLLLAKRAVPFTFEVRKNRHQNISIKYN